MKTPSKLLTSLLFAWLVSSTTLLAQGTDAFTYQGRLESANLPATGIYDLKFTVHSADLGGNIVAGPLTHSGVSVSNGLFTVVLNFGSGVFTGPERWLGIEARTNGAALYTRLAPRQLITPTPYAQYTANAANAATANGVSPDSVTASGIASGQVVKSLNDLHDNVTLVAGANVTLTPLNQTLTFGSPTDWHITGNAGTTSGPNFLGTTDNEPLELKVWSKRALRLEATTNSPNLIGGWSNNAVTLNTVGAVIGGGGTWNDSVVYVPGGALSTISFVNQPNSIQDTQGISSSYATIAGGVGNYLAGSALASIGGGAQNAIYARSTDVFGGTGSAISGGIKNRIVSYDFAAVCAVIGGGVSNTIYGGSFGTIAGGRQNALATRSSDATISGGHGNLIDGSGGATVSGGSYNTVNYLSGAGVVGGGVGNTIGNWGGIGTGSATIAGGLSNSIVTYGNGNSIGGGIDNGISGGSLTEGSTISGGRSNQIYNASSFAAIGGGYNNVIQTNADYGTISGGHANQIRRATTWTGSPTNSTISGGESNVLYEAGAVIGGGVNNRIGNASSSTMQTGHTIAGGLGNAVNYQNSYSTVSGGISNYVDGSGATIAGGSGNHIDWGPSFGHAIGGGANNNINGGAVLGYSVISGGRSNIVSGHYGAVPGGDRNSASAFAFAAGRRAKATDQGAFVWADCTDEDFASTAANQFLVRASGGVGIGNNTPAAVLDVYGSRIISAISDGIVNIGSSPGLHLTLDNNEIHARNGSGTSTLYVNHFGGNVNMNNGQLNVVFGDGVGIGTASLAGYKFYVNGTAYSTGGWSGSDARWKKNVQPVTHALEKVMELRGVTYEWKRDEFPEKQFESSLQLGFLAQDVERVVPEAVRTDSAGYKAIAYEKLTAVLTEGIKEQQREIQTLKEQNAQLQQGLSELKALVESLRRN